MGVAAGSKREKRGRVREGKGVRGMVKILIPTMDILDYT